MEALLNRLIANDLEDFEGLKIIGSIPVSERIVNELAQQFIQDTLQKEKPSAMPTGESDGSSNDTPQTPDVLGLAKKLDIHNFRITFQEGKMVLNVDIRR